MNSNHTGMAMNRLIYTRIVNMVSLKMQVMKFGGNKKKSILKKVQNSLVNKDCTQKCIKPHIREVFCLWDDA